MEDIFYSQQGEDCYVFNNYINIEREDGTFVELGAMNGLTYSNTKFFEDTLKFSGVLIEPTEQYNDLIKNRPKCKCYKNAINDKEEEIEFIGDNATAGLIKTMSSSFRNDHHKNNNNVYKVSGTPIKNLIKDLKHIDIFSIDVEGGELVVLETIDWKIPIYIIIIELDGYNKEKDEKCRNILREQGFSFDINIGGNEFWINKKYPRRLQLFDITKKRITHSVADYGRHVFMEPHLRNSINDKIMYRNYNPLPFDDNNKFICEDYFTDYVINNNGLVITRKEINVEKFNFDTKSPLVCLTGYSKVITHFFNDVIHKMNNDIILLIIESDEVDLKTEWLENSKLKHCYTWNKPFTHSKLSSLPIGLNYYRQYATLYEWLSKKSEVYVPKKLLAVNYSPNTNSIRGQLVEKANNEWKDFADVLQFIEPSKTYWKESKIEGRIKVDVSNPKCYDVMKEYKFILSPPGAGEDTHRTWEALYVGAIPIVRSSNLNELYKDLPVLVVENWDVINKEWLELEFKKIQENKEKNKYNMEKLNINYWLRKIRTPKIHFITYSNQVYEKARIRLVEEAKNFNEFETITGLSPDDLSNDFKDKFSEILKIPRIAGCGIWRPQIILDKLKKMKDGEYLLYLDAGCKLNSQGKKRFFEYVDMLNNSDKGIITIRMTGNNGPGGLCKEKEYSRREVFDYFNINLNSQIGNSPQCLSGVLLMKKNKHLMKIIILWLQAVHKNPLMFTDIYNDNNQDKSFIANRHEQSVLSILTQIHGSIDIDGDESWMQPFGEGESLKYPFWAARSKN